MQISKGSIRTSDWGAAELSEEQIAYAVADVRHVLELAAELREHLQAAGRDGLFDEVCAYLPVDAHLAVAGIPNPLNY